MACVCTGITSFTYFFYFAKNEFECDFIYRAGQMTHIVHGARTVIDFYDYGKDIIVTILFYHCGVSIWLLWLSLIWPYFDLLNFIMKRNHENDQDRESPRPL